MASWSVHSTPDQAVWVPALAGDIVLCQLTSLLDDSTLAAGMAGLVYYNSKTGFQHRYMKQFSKTVFKV